MGIIFSYPIWITIISRLSFYMIKGEEHHTTNTCLRDDLLILFTRYPILLLQEVFACETRNKDSLTRIGTSFRVNLEQKQNTLQREQMVPLTHIHRKE